MFMFVLRFMLLMFAAHFGEHLIRKRHLLDGAQNDRAVKLVPRRGEDGGGGILLLQQVDSGFQLLLRKLLRAREDDRAGRFDLVVVELAEVFHIHLDLCGVGDGDEAVEHQILALIHRVLHGDDHVGELAHAARLDQNAVGMELRGDLLERFAEVAHKGAADAAGGHLGDLDAGLLQKAAVDIDLAELVLDQHELFTAVCLRDQLFDERRLAGAEKAGENVNFRHGNQLPFS